MEGNGPVQATVDELITAQLDQCGPAGRAADLVLAALLGDDDLDAVLSGATHSGDHPPQHEPGAKTPLTGLFLRSIEAEGFRGIGPKAALMLQPGPGLTVVAGRNGSGKSSLAEAAELALTDDNKRWSGRTQIWRDGWRNLHTTGESRIGVELTADGRSMMPGGLRLQGAPRAVRKNLPWSGTPAGGNGHPASSAAHLVPVVNRDQETPYSGTGYVRQGSRSAAHFLDNYEIHQIDSQTILGYWIPAEDLAELSAHTGTIKVIAASSAPAESGQEAVLVRQAPRQELCCRSRA